MKETFQIVEDLKRARVVEDYAVARAVGDEFDSDRFLDLDPPVRTARKVGKARTLAGSGMSLFPVGSNLPENARALA